MPKRETLGGRLARARKARGFTQLDVAEKTGIKRPRIAEWETDLHTPGADALRQLAALYQTTVDALLSLQQDRVRLLTPPGEADLLVALRHMSVAMTELIDEALANRVVVADVFEPHS